MSSVELRNSTIGLLGYLHDIPQSDPDSILVFQLPRATNQMNSAYLEGILCAARKMLPEGKRVMIIGCDVNIYEIAGPDAVALKLKGII